MFQFQYSTHAWLTFVAMSFIGFTFSGSANGEEKESKATATQATYLITGLHCPPCTHTVEAALSKTKGVKSVKVDWRTQNAKIEFDESQLPAQVLAQQIAGTRHMMGGNMQYGGWLALKVQSVKDEAGAKAAKDAASKIAGVKSVTVYAAQESIGVQFDAQGKLTSQQVIEALAKAGITASNY